MAPPRCVISATLLLEMILLIGCEQQGPPVRAATFSGPTMGTSYTVKITDFPEEISILRQRLSEAEKYLKIDERKDQKPFPRRRILRSQPLE